MGWPRPLALAVLTAWVAATPATARSSFSEQPPDSRTTYVDLVAGYRTGRFAWARDRLAQWRVGSVAGGVEYFLASSPESAEALAAGLLHSEVLRLGRGSLEPELEALHLQSAEKLFESVTDDTRWAALREQWLLCLAYLLQSVDPSASLEYVTAARRLAPEDARTVLALGVWHEVTARSEGGAEGLQRAERLYRQALQLDPELMEARLRLGAVLAGQEEGSEEDAQRQLESVVERCGDPELVYLAYLFLGDVHRQTGLLDAAIRCYRAAVETRPRWQTAYLALSQALDANGEAREATAILKKALSLPASQAGHSDGYHRYRQGWVGGLRRAIERMRRELVQ